MAAVACSAALFVPFALVFFTSTAPFAIPRVEMACGQPPPDMRFFTSGDGVIGFLDGCGPAGRSAYRNMQLADLIYPALIGMFMASSLALVTRRLSASTTPARWLPAIPLAAAVFDYLENALAWLALASYPDPIATNDLLGVASAAKTTMSWLAGLGLIGGLVLIGVRFARRRAGRAHRGPVAVGRPFSNHSGTA